MSSYTDLRGSGTVVVVVDVVDVTVVVAFRLFEFLTTRRHTFEPPTTLHLNTPVAVSRFCPILLHATPPIGGDFIDTPGGAIAGNE